VFLIRHNILYYNANKDLPKTISQFLHLNPLLFTKYLFIIVAYSKPTMNRSYNSRTPPPAKARALVFWQD